MIGENTSKEQKNTSSELLNGPDNAGNPENSKNNKESEGSDEKPDFIVEIKESPSKSCSPNNSPKLSSSPMLDEIEIERRENYLFNNYLR